MANVSRGVWPPFAWPRLRLEARLLRSWRLGSCGPAALRSALCGSALASPSYCCPSYVHLQPPRARPLSDRQPTTNAVESKRDGSKAKGILLFRRWNRQRCNSRRKDRCPILRLVACGVHLAQRPSWRHLLLAERPPLRPAVSQASPPHSSRRFLSAFSHGALRRDQGRHINATLRGGFGGGACVR